MEVGLSSRSTSSRDLKAAIVERVRAKTLAQLQAQQQQQQERDRLLSLASEHGRSGSSFWSPGPTAPSYDDDDDGESTKCSALVKRVPVLLLIFASCSIVLALIAKWVPVGITSVLASSVAVPPAAGSAPEVLPDFPPPAPEPSPPPPPKQLCSVLFDGDHCKKQKTLPKCMDTTFHGHMTLGNWIDGDLGDDQYLYEDVISLMPEEDVFGRRPGSPKILPSCALVSNGALLKGKGMGKLIDANAYVLRLNNAPTKGYEADVGRRTSARLVNGGSEGFREGAEAVISWKWDAVEANHARKDPNSWNFRMLALLEKKVYALNADFRKYVQDSRFISQELETRASAGFTGMMMLLHVCHKVNLYGFNTAQTLAELGESAMDNWYYDKQPFRDKSEWVRAASAEQHPTSWGTYQGPYVGEELINLPPPRPPHPPPPKSPPPPAPPPPSPPPLGFFGAVWQAVAGPKAPRPADRRAFQVAPPQGLGTRAAAGAGALAAAGASPARGADAEHWDGEARDEEWEELSRAPRLRAARRALAGANATAAAGPEAEEGDRPRGAGRGLRLFVGKNGKPHDVGGEHTCMQQLVKMGYIKMINHR